MKMRLFYGYSNNSPAMRLAAIGACMLTGGFPGMAHGDSDPELSTYVVTGTRTERLLYETPVKTELVSQQELEKYNLTTLRDALKLIPSARFENECQNCALNQIQLLGLGTDYTAILFDGASLYSGLAKVYGADLFPAAFVSRIEVVKGGSSVLYGPEAIAGVVNLITAEPLYNRWEIRSNYESLLGDASKHEHAFRGDWVDREHGLSVRVFGLRQDREELDLSGDGFSDIPRFENTVVGMQGWLRPMEDATLKLTWQYIDQQHRGGDLLCEPEEQARVSESLAHRIHMLHMAWAHGITEMVDYHLRASMLSIRRESFYGARGDNEQRAWELAGFEGDVIDAWIEANHPAIDEVAKRVWGGTDNLVLFLDSQLNCRLVDHTLSAGVQFRFENLKDASLYAREEVPSTQDDFQNLGFFVQDQWVVDDRLEVVTGLRYDTHSNVDGSVFSPRVAGRYFVTNELTARASWSTGFNAPGAFNEDKHIGVNNGGAIFLVNDPNLEEENSQTWSVGFEYHPDRFDRRLILHSQIHYTRLRNTFEIDDTGALSGDPNLWLRVNGPDSRIVVWENSLNWYLDDELRLDAGVSWIDSRYDEAIERVTDLETDRFLKQPRWTAHAGLSYDRTDGFEVHAFMSYTGSMIAVGHDSDFWRTTPEFWVMDLGLSKTFEQVLARADVVLSLGVKNALDHRQKDLQNNGEQRDPTYLYGPVEPRTWYAGFRLIW